MQVYMEVEKISRSRKNQRDGAWVLGFPAGGAVKPCQKMWLVLASLAHWSSLWRGATCRQDGTEHFSLQRGSPEFKGSPGYKVRHHHPEHVEGTLASNHHALPISKPATSLSPQEIQINNYPPQGSSTFLDNLWRASIRPEFVASRQSLLPFEGLRKPCPIMNLEVSRFRTTSGLGFHGFCGKG